MSCSLLFVFLCHTVMLLDITEVQKNTLNYSSPVKIKKWHLHGFPRIIKPISRLDSHQKSKDWILPHILHFSTYVVSGGNFVKTCEIDSRSTHGVFGGSFPSFSLSLLCTTKIPNSVRFESRSDSGSSWSSASTSFWSSFNAYLHSG
jgi:hypothetical protein